MYALPVARSNSLADLAARIKAEHEAATAAVRDSVAHAMAAGEMLIKAKKKVPHGQWLPWLHDHCGMPTRTAQTYMELARLKPNAQRVADLPLRRAVLHLRQLRQREEREAQRQQEHLRQAQQQHPDAIMTAALDTAHDQLNPPEPPCGYPDCGCPPWDGCGRHPQMIVLALIEEQLAALEARKARRADAIDELVTQILAAVREVDDLGVTVQDIIDALTATGVSGGCFIIERTAR
jgi:Protein of unknown function (DUF3102)